MREAPLANSWGSEAADDEPPRRAEPLTLAARCGARRVLVAARAPRSRRPRAPCAAGAGRAVGADAGAGRARAARACSPPAARSIPAEPRHGGDAPRRREVSPSYFGSKDYDGRPRPRGPRSTSSASPAASSTARRAPSASARAGACRDRSATSASATARTRSRASTTSPWSAEAGLGVGYEQRNWRAFTDVRYGVIGHNSWVGELGADAIAYPVEGLTLTAGPRLSFGSDKFARHLLRRVATRNRRRPALDDLPGQRRPARRRDRGRRALPLQRALGRRGRRQLAAAA